MGVKMRSFFDQIFDQNFDQNFEKNFHENSTFVPVSLKSKIYGRKVEIFWKLPSFNKIYSDFIKFLLKIYGTNYEIYCVIKGSFWGPQDPLDPPGTPKKGCFRNKPSILPPFWPLGTPPGPLILGVPNPEKMGFTEQTLDFTPFWILRTPWPWPGLFGKMGGLGPPKGGKKSYFRNKTLFLMSFSWFWTPDGPPETPKIAKNC